jgi:hypothetical protein
MTILSVGSSGRCAAKVDPILINDGDKKKLNLLFIQNVAYMLQST